VSVSSIAGDGEAELRWLRWGRCCAQDGMAVGEILLLA
jgi:hypothetical protein